MGGGGERAILSLDPGPKGGSNFKSSLDKPSDKVSEDPYHTEFESFLLRKFSLKSTREKVKRKTK